MGVPHVHTQVMNSDEGVVCHHTSYNPAIVGTFPIRVSTTIWFVLSPCLFDLKNFSTKGTNKPTWGHNRVSPMLGLVMFVHGSEHLQITFDTLGI